MSTPIFESGTRLIAIHKTTVEAAFFPAGASLGIATGKQRKVECAKGVNIFYVGVYNKRLGFIEVLSHHAEKDTPLSRAEAAYHRALDTGVGIGEALQNLYRVRDEERGKSLTADAAS